MNPANDTNWITKFNINVTSNSNKVFGNGRQQLEISVSVTPKSGVDITPEQLDSIRLVTLDDDGVYQALSGDLQASTKRNSLYELYADTGSAPSPLLQGNALRRRFYVSSSLSGGSVTALYAAISKDDETEYVSNTSKFNSFVNVETLTPLRLIRDNFSFDAQDNHLANINSTAWDYDVNQLYIKGHGLRLVDAIAYGPASGEAYFQNILREDSGWDFDGLSPDISRSFTHIGYGLTAQREFTVPNATLQVNRVPHSMIFIRIYTNGTAFLSGVVTRDAQWGLIDQYGNEHRIKMTQLNHGQHIDFVMTE